MRLPVTARARRAVARTIAAVVLAGVGTAIAAPAQASTGSGAELRLPALQVKESAAGAAVRWTDPTGQARDLFLPTADGNAVDIPVKNGVAAATVPLEQLPVGTRRAEVELADGRVGGVLMTVRRLSRIARFEVNPTPGWVGVVAVVQHSDGRGGWVATQAGPVALQMKVHGHWRTLVTRPTDETGLAVLTAPVAAGKHTFRVKRLEGATVTAVRSHSATVDVPAPGSAW